jgi:hypothetical protein
MSAEGGLRPYANFTMRPAAAGGDAVKDSKTSPPGASSMVFSLMLDLLETLRHLVLSGYEPAPFLAAVQRSGRPVMIACADPERQLARLRNEYGPTGMAFSVSARPICGGLLLRVAELSGEGRRCLDQFCRRTAAGRYEALPDCWRESAPRQPSFAKASSAYHSTSGLIPYWGFRNSDLLNHLIS